MIVDSKDKIIFDALCLLEKIAYHHLEHRHECLFDENEEDYECQCGKQDILDKIEDLNNRVKKYNTI